MLTRDVTIMENVQDKLYTLERQVWQLHTQRPGSAKISKAFLDLTQVERNLAHVEGDLDRGKKIGKLGAYAYRAIAEDWAGSKRAADQTQASLFDGASGGVAAQGTPSPPASEVVSGEAARRDREAAEAARLDAVLAELDIEAQGVLDAEAVRALRGRAHPGWQEIERAIEVGLEDELGPASGGALRMARRDVIAAWLERDG